MPCTLEQSDAVRRYYAAFPALRRGDASAPQYYLPLWPAPRDMPPPRKERRHACQQRRRRRHRQLPEWFDSDGSWDMEANDPVKEFIRALALDEGYGTAETTLNEEPRPAPPPAEVPDWEHRPDDWLLRDDLQPRALTPADEELYAKFEAKFDRSLEALWDERRTPDDYQELPIDLHDLLASPSDRPAGLQALQLQDREPAPQPPPQPQPQPQPPPLELETFALYSGDELYDALSSVAGTLRSLTAINHSRDRSGFVEVPPRPPAPARAAAPAPAPVPAPPPPAEDLLTSSRTHFRPIRAGDTAARYEDGDSFDIRGDLEPVEFRRSARGGVYVGSALYLEYRSRSIDYGRLELTPAQQQTLDEPPRFKLRFPLRQRDQGVQTDAPAWPDCGHAGKKMRANIDTIWSCTPPPCELCNAPTAPVAPVTAPDELSREWEELLADISAAHAEYARGDVVEEMLVSAERKRRHSAALSPAARADCSHPHARFLHCCAAQLDRPLTR